MTTPRILFVDDDPNILSGYQRALRKRFTIEAAQSGADGLRMIEANGPYAVIIADMQMPGMNGVEFLRTTMDKAPDSVRLMLTGNADQKTAVEAVNQGHVFSFLSKPCPSDSLERALDTALRQYELVCSEKKLLEETLNGSIKVLTDILAIIDPEAFGHAQRLRAEVRAVADWFGVAHAWEFELAAMLSPIGIVAIPPALLNRARLRQNLTAVEKGMWERVPEMGANLVANIPRMESVAEIVRYQRKNFDGTGFPHGGVAGTNIPMGARILRVISDLLTIEASLKTRAEAFGHLKHRIGVYDPKVLEAVASCFDLFVGNDGCEHKTVLFSELRVGHILVSDIVTKDGTMVVAAGAQVSQALMSKLHNFHELVGVKEPIEIV